MKTNDTPSTPKARLLGRYIVADPKICHGQPTFRGTRIMVWQVLEQIASGMAWESIVEEWQGSITADAIAEALKLAGQAFVDHAEEYVLEPTFDSSNFSRGAAASGLEERKGWVRWRRLSSN